jgi:hypothetical protein
MQHKFGGAGWLRVLTPSVPLVIKGEDEEAEQPVEPDLGHSSEGIKNETAAPH